MENEVIVSPVENDSPIAQIPVAAVAKQFAALQQFVKTQMKVGCDYGVIPGCKKASLWKPGAEKLLNLHGLACRLDVDMAQSVLDWKGGFISYTYKATVYNPRTNNIIATADGSCNSAEKKYEHESDPRRIAHTLSRMAQKRAVCGATLMACRASDIFSTDMSDDEDNKGSAPVEKTERFAKGEEAHSFISFIPGKISEKDGSGAKGPWKKFGIQPVGSPDWYGTFDSKFGAIAKQALDDKSEITVWFKDDGKYKTITEIGVKEEEIPGM